MGDREPGYKELREKLDDIAQRLDKVGKEKPNTEESENGGGYQF